MELLCVLSCFSSVWLCVALWTVGLQADLSMGLSRQEYCSGCHSLFRGSSRPRNQTRISCSSCTVGIFFTPEAHCGIVILSYYCWHTQIYFCEWFVWVIKYISDLGWKVLYNKIVNQFRSVVQPCPTLETPWTAAHQASLSITNSRSLPKPMPIESMMPSNHLILCLPLVFLPSVFASIKVFSNESALHIR